MTIVATRIEDIGSAIIDGIRVLDRNFATTEQNDEIIELEIRAAAAMYRAGEDFVDPIVGKLNEIDAAIRENVRLRQAPH